MSSVAERRSIIAPLGETFVLPGGRTITAIWRSSPVVALDVSTTTAAITAIPDDVEHLVEGDRITRLATRAQYTVRTEIQRRADDFAVVNLEKV